MTVMIKGPQEWSLVRDAETHREYKLRTFLETTDPSDGPYTILNTPGLPRPGDAWRLGNDNDPWAFCQWNADVGMVVKNEPNRHWFVDQRFTTKPPNNKTCRDRQVENPLLEPMKVSGGFTKYTEEATTDRFDLPVRNSAHEIIRGPQVEFDNNRATVRVEQNVAALQLALFAGMMDTVNPFPLWGMDLRCVKLSNAHWEKKYYGTCLSYYTRSFEWDLNRKTFDRDVLDEGTKVLHGYWDRVSGAWTLLNINGLPPDPFNPAHFDRAKDRNGECCKVPLNGLGQPYSPDITLISAGACSHCPDRAPQTWYVIGLQKANGDDLDPVEVSYAFGCTWIGADPDSNLVKLEWDDPLGTWTVHYETTPVMDYTYTDPVADFNCLGDNYLYKFDPNLRIPNSIIIRPKSNNTPGSIHVEKYGESNFLLLGIPTIL